MLVLERGAEKAHRCELWMSRKMGLFGQGPPCKMPVCSCCRGARGSYVWHLLCALPLLSAVRPKPGYLSLFHMGVSSLLLPIVVLRPRVELERLLTAAGGVDPTQGKKRATLWPMSELWHCSCKEGKVDQLANGLWSAHSRNTITVNALFFPTLDTLGFQTITIFLTIRVCLYLLFTSPHLILSGT